MGTQQLSVTAAQSLVQSLLAAGLDKAALAVELARPHDSSMEQGTGVDAALIAAASEGHAQRVAELLADGAKIDVTCTRKRWTPLMHAAYNGHASVVVQLLCKGADANVADSSGVTAAALAGLAYLQALEEQVAATRQASQAQSKSDKARRTGDAASPAACKRMFKLLIVATTRAWRPARTGKVPTGSSQAATDPVPSAPPFLDSGINPDLSEALLCAVRKGHVDKAKQLLALRADPNAVYTRGKLRDCTALVQAVDTGDMSLVLALLAAGADVNLAPIGMSPLAAAAGQFNGRMLTVLLGAGANPNAMAPTFDKNALMVAGMMGNPMGVAVLLAAGADPNTCTPSGHRTPLMMAVEAGCDSAVGMLLTGGARVNAADEDGNTALMLASKGQNAQVVTTLLQGGADRALRNKAGHTALTLALGRKPGPSTFEVMLGADDATVSAAPRSSHTVTGEVAGPINQLSLQSQAVSGALLSEVLPSSWKVTTEPGVSHAAMTAASDSLAAELIAEEEAEKKRAAEKAVAAKAKREKRKAKQQGTAVGSESAASTSVGAQVERQDVAGASVSEQGTASSQIPELAQATAQASTSTSKMAERSQPVLSPERPPLSMSSTALPVVEAVEQLQPQIQQLQVSVAEPQTQAEVDCSGCRRREHLPDDVSCVVCMEARRTVLLLPCGHVVLCSACADAVQARNNECPMCREPIDDAIDMIV